MTREPLVLASASESRARLLEGAGVAFEVSPASVDEETIRESMEAEGYSSREVADALAEAKACRSSGRFPGRTVLGCDQILVCEGRVLAKPQTRDLAMTQLLALRGREHTLLSAAVLARDGAPIWRCIQRADLRMRVFSDEFLEWYLKDAGDAVCRSVGAYHFEKRGVQLFEAVSGDHFVILGLPLLPLLAQLRELDLLQR